MADKQLKPYADKAQKARWICDILRQEFPACFKKAVEKQPIKSGIHVDLDAHYKQDTRFTEDELRLALAFYTRGIDYLKTIITGTERIGLDGSPAGKVNTGDEQYAQRLLQAKLDIHNQTEPQKAYAKPIVLKQPDNVEILTPISKTNKSLKTKSDKNIAYVA